MAYGDPWDISNTDQPPASPGGVSPDAWRNLALFGSAMSAAAGARDSLGLPRFPGFAGALSQGVAGGYQGDIDVAKARSGLAYQGAQTADVRSQIAQRNIANRLGLFNLNLNSQLYGGPQFDEQGNPLPAGTQSPYSIGAGQPQASSATGNAPFTSGQPAGALSMPQGFSSAIAGIEAPKLGAPQLNAGGYAGKYQFGTAALQSAGLYQPAQGEDVTKNAWQGKITIPGYDPMTVQQFTANPQAQDTAFERHMGNLSQEATQRGFGGYVGQTIGGVPIAQDTLAGMMHFGGAEGTQKFLESGGQYNPADSNGTTLSAYAMKAHQAFAATPPAYQVASLGPVPPPSTGAPPQRPQGPQGPPIAQGGQPQPLPQNGGPPVPSPSAAGITPQGPQGPQIAQSGPQISVPPCIDGMTLARGIITGQVPASSLTPQQATAAAPWISRINPDLGKQLMEYGLAGPQAGAQEAARRQAGLPFVGPEEAAKAANQITTDRFGNMYRGGVLLGRGSEVKEVWNPQTNQYEWGDVGGLGVGRPETLGAGASAGTSGVPAKPPPMQQAFMQTRGTHLAEQQDKIDADAASAVEGNYLFDNLRNDSKSWDMGKFADFEGDARAYLSAFAQTFGIATPQLNQKLADFQAFGKSAGMLLRTAVHDTSSRAAVQEYNLIGQTLPQPTTSAQGFGQIADQWQGLNDFRLAKQQFAQNFQGNPQDFNVAFNSKVSPATFLLNRMSQTPQGQQDMQAMLVRMQQSPEGKLLAGRLLEKYRYAKSAGLFNDLPPSGSAAGQQAQ